MDAFPLPNKTFRPAGRCSRVKPGSPSGRAALVVALLSGLAALSIAVLPLLLVLLLLLFDRVTQGVMVLVGALLDWLRSLLPAGSGGALPPYRALLADPLAVAGRALPVVLPCTAGLVLGVARRWRAALSCWGRCMALALAEADLVTAAILAPGLLAVLLLDRSA